MKPLIRYVVGIAEINVIGSYTERFINLCSRRNFILWDMYSSAGHLSAKVPLFLLPQLEEAASDSECVLEITKQTGLPLILKRLSARKGLICGIVIFFCGLMFLSGRIWRIEIDGDDTIDDCIIEQNLSLLGLKKGTNIKKMDLKATGERLRIMCPELGSAAISYRGSVCLVTVTKRTVNSKTQTPIPQNLIAGHSGIVKLVLCTNGHSAVKAGDVVTEGQLLISGIFEDYYGKSTITNARGKVIAQTERIVEFEFDKRQTEYISHGKTNKRYGVNILGYYIPLFWPNKAPLKVYTEYFPVKVAGFELDMGLYVHQIEKISFEAKQLDTNMIKTKVLNLANEYIKTLETEQSQAEIIAITEQANTVKAQVKITSTENIAVQQNLSLQ